MPQGVLFVTVGGLHQPIVAAIRHVRPDHVVFFCTDRDPATGRPGSVTQVTGQGLVVKAAPADAAATLPNIPTQAGLAPEQHSAVIVPADEIDAATDRMHAALRDWRRRDPGARLVADYTGGTKTMSAALVLAGLEVSGVELQVVTGARADLVRVRSGTEAACGVEIERLRFARAFDAALAPCKRYAYDESALVLDSFGAPRNPALRACWQRVRDLSRAFAAWDRFDLEAGRDGKRQAGLFAAWQLLAHHLPDSPAGRFFAAHRGRLLNQLRARNLSILAHGFKPIDRHCWSDIRDWADRDFLPVLPAELEVRKIRLEVPQLPTDGGALAVAPQL